MQDFCHEPYFPALLEVLVPPETPNLENTRTPNLRNSPLNPVSMALGPKP